MGCGTMVCGTTGRTHGVEPRAAATQGPPGRVPKADPAAPNATVGPISQPRAATGAGGTQKAK